MTEHPKQADSLEREADDMAERSERLGGQISDAREDWERKVADEKVPGTPPAPKGSDDEDGPSEEREPWPDE
jgi:hypothetical protein